MKTFIILLAALVGFALTSCEIDNYEAPAAILSGTVTYNGNPVGVRTNGTQLELWQDGYALREKIAVHIAQDGTYSARLFSGEYKMVRLAGAPWKAESSDTIVINVNGNTTQDVEVEPYFIVHDAVIQQLGNVVQAEFVVDQIDTEASLSNVKLYLSKSQLVDENYKDLAVSADISTVVSGETTTLIASLPESLLQAGYLFARVGVRSDQANEYYYTQVQKLDIDGDVAINPTADFTMDVNGKEVTFTNSSTHGVSYAWDFGDGNSSTEENPTHTYTEDGEFTVGLTVTGGDGTLPATTTRTISVGYVAIAVVNGDFEIPGTGRIKDWQNATITGWTSDIPTTDSGVEAGYGQDNNYRAILHESKVFNLTDHVIGADEQFKVTFDARNIWEGAEIAMTLYYDAGDGVRHVLGTVTETGMAQDQWNVSYELVAAATEASVGAKLGIEMYNVTAGWIAVDNVELFVK